MSEQLDSAYNLIKQGQKQEAIDLLEPLIRADRDNEDAWWLLANASDDSSAKRNALNNVLRLTDNDNRKIKAQTLLQRLNDDPFDFDIESAPMSGITSSGMRDYKALDEAKRAKSGGMGKIALILVGIFGVCALFSCIGIYWAAGGIMQALTYSQDYDNMGILTEDTTVNGELSTESSRDGFIYSGDADDTFILTVDYESLGSPIITIFDESSQEIKAYSQPDTGGSVTFSFTLPTDGDYLITINGFKFVGQEFGMGEYTMEFESR